MGFNSAFKGLKLLKKTPGNGRLNNLNDPVLNVLIQHLLSSLSVSDLPVHRCARGVALTTHPI